MMASLKGNYGSQQCHAILNHCYIWFECVLQVLALFAGQPYDSELQDLENLDSHLTNTCRLEGALQEEEAVRLLSELPQVGVHKSQNQTLCILQ